MNVTTGIILFDPVLPIWLVVPVIVAFAAAAWVSYGKCALDRPRRLGLWGLRIAAILVLVWLLGQPERRRVRLKEDPPTVALAVDVSVSMTERLPGVVVGREEKAAEFLADSKVRGLGKRYRLVQYEIGREVQESSTPPERLLFNAPRSRIVSGVNRIVDKLRGANLAAIILLTDGLDQSGEDLTPQARTVPLLIPELEKPLPEIEKQKEQPDAWIADVSFPKMTVVNWKTGIDVLIRRRGDGAVSFPIHFYQQKRRLRSSVVEFAAGEHFKQVSFEIEPIQTGRILYRVEIMPENDAREDNNRREFLIEVTNAKNRVLYLEGAPRWEFKFLKRALLAERNYQLDAYVQGGTGAFISFSEADGAARAKAPELNADGLAGYRVVILGDLPGSALQDAEWRAVRDFVEKGGGLLLVGAARAYGKEGWAKTAYMQELLPAVSEAGARMHEGRFSVDLTPQGRVHPALRALQAESSLPPILSIWGPVKVGQFSTTLVGALDGSPVVVVRRYGQGRVAMTLSDTLWRWQLGSSGTGLDKSLYARYVTQLVYWLAPREKEIDKTGILQVLTAKSEVEIRERVAIGAVYQGTDEKLDSLTCTITTPDGQRLPYPMSPAVLGDDVGLGTKTNGFKCVFSPAKPGKYEISVSTPDGARSARLLLLATRAERERTGAPLNRNLLTRLAAETGGSFVPWKKRYSLLRKVPYQPRRLKEITEKPIWNRWWWLLVLVVLFSLEWWWRRRLDLV